MLNKFHTLSETFNKHFLEYRNRRIEDNIGKI